jgi:hypothetical protein
VFSKCYSVKYHDDDDESSSIAIPASSLFLQSEKAEPLTVIDLSRVLKISKC